MFVKYSPEVRGLKGSSRRSQLVFCVRQGQTYAYEKPEPRDARSPDQLAQRAMMKASTDAWGALTPAQRTAWDAYAARHGALVAEPGRRPLRGMELFVRAGIMARTLELPPPADAPVLVPPCGLDGFEPVAAAEGALRLKITHCMGPADGLLLVVKATAPSPSPARKPRAKEARMVHGLNARSAVPLPLSGGEVEFSGIRYPVAPGQRFGVVVQIVRGDGALAGRSAWFDLTMPYPPQGGEAAPMGSNDEGDPVDIVDLIDERDASVNSANSVNSVNQVNKVSLAPAFSLARSDVAPHPSRRRRVSSLPAQQGRCCAAYRRRKASIVGCLQEDPVRGLPVEEAECEPFACEQALGDRFAGVNEMGRMNPDGIAVQPGDKKHACQREAHPCHVSSAKAHRKQPGGRSDPEQCKSFPLQQCHA